jgi:hypothetical protein
MKSQKIAFIVFILLLGSICAMTRGTEEARSDERAASSVAEAQEPNVFELKGMGIEVTYSTTSFTGQPQLTYRDKKRTLTFHGEEIRQVDSEIGQQVTVTLEQVPDLRTETLTLILPAINVEGAGTSFQTNAILTTHRTSIGGPDLVKGVLQTYRIKTLRGTARTVVF